MSEPGLSAPQPDGTGLLEEAISYALTTVHAVTPELLHRATPCQGWDLRMLLSHCAESLTALHEAVAAGRMGLLGSPNDGRGDAAAGPDDPAQDVTDRAGGLLRAWAAAGGRRPVIAIADRCVALHLLADVGALEMAVHGWDISRASGRCRPIPPALASDLLEIAPLLVPVAGRQPLFAAPVAMAATACPSDRLAAFLGRCPY